MWKNFVLINTPELGRGGVSDFYTAVRPFLPAGIDYFPAGRRRRESSPLATVARLARDYAAYARALQRGDYRIVHLNPSVGPKSLIRDAGFCLLAKLFRRRLLVFFHGWDFRHERLLRVLRPIYFRADAIVVLGERFRQRLRAMGWRRPIYVESTAAGEEAFETPIETRPSGAPFTVLFLARLVKAKGLYEAIDAYAIARARRPDMRLIIAGDGPDLGPARELVAARGLADVTFTGFVTAPRKPQLFAEADCYLLPSHGEGMPCSLLEAMAYGLPVITRPVGGIADFFEDGRMGYLESSTDPENFAAHLLALAADRERCRELGAYNRQYAREHFAASRVAERLRAIYGEVAGD